MLTPKQKELLDFIVAQIEATGIAPTYADMIVACELKSKSGVRRMLLGLEERGYIRRIPRRRQAIEVIRKPGEAPRDDLKDQLRFAIEWIEGLPTLSAAQAHDKAAALKALGRPHNVLALTGMTAAEAAREILAQVEGGAQ